jgi:Zn finger protein HypA/HybF involved in hydrogenase expression
MFELQITDAILDVVRRRVPEHRAGNIRRVHICLGDELPVVAETLARSFAAAVGGTHYYPAMLAIRRVPGSELTVREIELEDGLPVLHAA